MDFVTLFPEMVLPGLRHSMLRRAEEAGIVEFHAVDPRSFAKDAHRTVDGKPCGGGPGMVLRADLVGAAIDSVLSADATVILMDPTGETFRQPLAHELSVAKHLIIVCGHYEGIDDRIRQHYQARTVSVGDFVLTGGELPAMLIADAVVRLLPGVLGDADSLAEDSHSRDGLLSYPQFTLPRDWNGLAVPEVLLSGDHGAVAKWRRQESLRTTRERRPDLLCRAKLSKTDLDLLQ